MEKKHKGREWVKTVAIIFLLILLILTFFSNTIMNMTLAEVSTVEVKDGSISAKVRATGKVTALGNNEVKAEGTRTIAAVKVKEGQEVNEGDILFVMGEAGSEELENATDARDSAYFALRRQQASYPIDNSYDSYSIAVEEVDAANYRLASARQAYSEAEGSYAAELEEALAAKNLADAAYSAIKPHYDEEQLNIDTAVAMAQNTYDTAASTLKMAEEAYYFDPTSPEKTANLETAKTKYAEAGSQLSAAKQKENVYANDYNLALNDKNNAQARYEAALDSSGLSAYLAEVTAAESALSSAQSAASSAYSSHISSRAQYNQSVVQQNINTEEAQMNLDKQQAKVDNLSGVGEDINVYAKVSGIVSSLSFSSGDKVTKDDVMCTIEVPDMGYKLESTVTKDQASRIKVGDVGEQTNYYWGKSITGTISSIRADPKSPQDKRIVTFDLEGDVTSGQELTLSVGSRTASYDYIVPKSAVKSDNNGNFVLKIESKNNALGNRYFAKRVTVEILAEDDSYRAISGDLGYGDFVITNSSTKVNPGDQVRLADSNG